MKNRQVNITDVEGKLLELLEAAQSGPIIITQYGEACGVIEGFADDNDVFDWHVRNDSQIFENFTPSDAARTDFPPMQEGDEGQEDADSQKPIPSV